MGSRGRKIIPEQKDAVVGDSAPDPAAATEIAKKHSPLQTVVGWAYTPPGPVKTVLYGKDQEGRDLAVWVRGNRDNVEHFVYLDLGITKQKGEEIVKGLGVAGQDITWIILDTQQRGDVRSVFWTAYVLHRKTNGLTKHEMIYIDFRTGNVTKRTVLVDDAPFFPRRAAPGTPPTSPAN